MNENEATALIVMLCDQPFVDTELLKSLAEEWDRTNSQIIATRSSTAPGPPALFPRAYFPQLAELRGTAGARSLFSLAPAVGEIHRPEAGFDLDTPDDAEIL